MDYKEFSIKSITELDFDTFESLRNMLVGEYLTFSIIPSEDVTREVLAEKVCDYFEKLEIKTNRNFDKQLEAYFRDLDSIVGERVARTPRPKKNMPAEPDCRARKYYNKALSVKNIRNWSISNLVDYTRIMLCLYTAVINNQYKEIEDLDFSVDCLNPKVIIEAMKNESDVIPIKIGRKHRFDIRELYCSDTGTFIITIILLHKILNSRVQGEYE